MELTNTNVRYLLTIYHLSQARLEVSSKDIAETLAVSRASVTSMMAILTDKRNPESGVMEIRGEELQFGDFRKGRYAWIFENFFAAPEPIAALGKQGWWKTEVPDGWGK